MVENKFSPETRSLLLHSQSQLFSGATRYMHVKPSSQILLLFKEEIPIKVSIANVVSSFKILSTNIRKVEVCG